jgi:diguanylate cyclase (GGDEF)-like protein
VYAAASAVVLLGFRRFFARKISSIALALCVVMVVIAIAVFHYIFDSFAMRTMTVALFQSAIALFIGLTIFQSRQAWRLRYPYLFTEAMAVVVSIGHGVRGIIYATGDGMPTSLLQPSAWNLFFLSAGTLVLPVFTLGAVMMVHDTMMTKSEHAANRDFLTGAWSRRAFFELAERELSRARRTGRKLSLLLLDVDHFKNINDSHGHAGGDRVLVDIVLRADMAIRDIDYFGRVGGEEFAVLLPETDRSAAMLVAERLRSTLERTAQADSARDMPGIAAYTVSIGLAVLRDSESFQELMGRADAALYKAKASGRNTVVAFPR